MLKLLSLFSGIGAFEKALDYLNVEYELVNYCEIDKYASKAYSLIHNVSEDKNLWDVTKVDTSKLPKDIDLITYGFPCQDISLAGKQKGFADEKGNTTRSGLFFQALRIIEDTKPKIAIAENVKNLVSKKFKNEFAIVLKSLEDAGYNNYWKVLNAKDYGTPQNRERVFIVSIRKDIDTHNILEPFIFPEPFKLKTKLKDMLEEKVDEKYYLNGERVESLINQLATTKQIETLPCCCDSTINEPKVRDVSNCITARYDAGIQNQKQIGLCVVEQKQPYILIKNATKQGYLEAEPGDGIDIGGRMKYHRGTVQKGISQTLTTSGGESVGVVINEKSLFTETEAKLFTEDGNIRRYIGSDKIDEFKEGQMATTSFPNGYGHGPRTHDISISLNTIDKPCVKYNLRIRKLTPKECFRLMGFNDESIDVLIKNGISNTQLYKCAGNSIVVSVIQHIFIQLFKSGVINL